MLTSIAIAIAVSCNSPQACQGDYELSDVVDVDDFLFVINHWDVDCNVDDLLQVINHWGDCPPGIGERQCAVFNAGELDKLSGISGLPPLAYPFSVLVKEKPTSFGNGSPQAIWSFANWSANNQYIRLVRTSTGAACWRDAGAGSSACSTSSIPQLGQWNSYVVSYAAINDGKLYLNAVPGSTTDTATCAVPSINRRMRVGEFAGSGGGSFLSGRVAELVILNRAVTPEEVTDYHAGVSPLAMFTTSEMLHYASFQSSLAPELGAPLNNLGVTLASADHPFRIDYYPQSYAAVPRVFIKPSELAYFQDLLLNDHKAAKRGMLLGDSNSAEFGAAGWVHMIRRRYHWHQIRGHTPGTQLVGSRQDSGIGPTDNQFWLHHQRAHLPSDADPPYSDWQLPPGFGASGETASVRKYCNDFNFEGDGGVHIVLSHNFDSGCNDEPAEAVNGGDPAFLGGTMEGPGSYINATVGGTSALRVEVAALSSVGGANDILVESQPIGGWFLPIPLVGTPTATSVICAGLNAAPGACIVQQTAPITLPSGSETHCRVRITGNHPENHAWILGSRIVSDDPRGLIIDSLSHAGYYSNYLLLYHGGSFPIMKSLGYDFAIIRYGALDGSMNPAVHPAVFDRNLRDLITAIRNQFGDPDFPVIIEAPPHMVASQKTPSGSFTKAFDYYASVAFNLSLELGNVCCVNEIRICEEDDGWTEANTPVFAPDGVHYTSPAGAESVANAAVTVFVTEGLGWQPPKR